MGKKSIPKKAAGVAASDDKILRPDLVVDDERLLASRALIGKIFGVTYDTVAKWPVKPVIKRGIEVLYYLPEVAHFRCGGDSDAPRLNPAQEKALLDKTRRERAEIDLAKERGEIVLVSDVCKDLEKELITVRQRLLSLPNKLARTLVPMDKPQQIQDTLYQAVCDALKDLNYGERIHFADQGNNSGNAKAPAAPKSS